jgi:hypothetical protein
MRRPDGEVPLTLCELFGRRRTGVGRPTIVGPDTVPNVAGDASTDEPVDRSFVEDRACAPCGLLVADERQPRIVDAVEDQRCGGCGRDPLGTRQRPRGEDALDGPERLAVPDGPDERDDPADELAGEPLGSESDDEEVAVAVESALEITDRPVGVGGEVVEVVLTAERGEGGGGATVVDLGCVQVVRVRPADGVVGGVKPR